ncbi:MAG TPA: DUF1615 domain-containing protein [Steroidobacteraceae bacterium]|nr:DUF1615 domain-containing protein [Steroidobacteraceae bacterium]
MLPALHPAVRVRPPAVRASARVCRWALPMALLAGCFGEREPAPAPTRQPADAHAVIEAALPARVSHRDAWASDIEAVLKALKLTASPEHVCAIVAVIEQESSFQVDPVVPGLSAIAWREIDRRAEQHGVPPTVLHQVLKLHSSDGRSYAERIDAARTEKDLSDIFEDFIGSVPLGRTLFESANPIRTRGPMQVNVAFAERFAKTSPYPFPHERSLEDELFTRRGSLYFGIAHLLAYPADYDRYLYRFADYNAGQYASRNAAFQRALAALSGVEITPDGALQSPGEGADHEAGETERAALAIAARLDLNAADIREALAQGRTSAFEATRLYQRVMARARASGRAAPYAVIPSIRLQGPKLHSRLTTEWYAHRVDERYQRCLQRS